MVRVVKYANSISQGECDGLSSGSGCYDFVGLSNLSESDNKYAIIPKSGGVNSTHPSPVITLKNFGFSIPKNAVITNASIQINRRNDVTSGGVRDRQVRFLTGNITNKALTDIHWGQSDYTKEYDMSVSGLNRSVVNSSSFGVKFQATGTDSGWGTPCIDFIRIVIEYDVPTYTISSSVNISKPIVNTDEIEYSVILKNTNGVHNGESMNIPISIPTGLSYLGLINNVSSSYSNGLMKVSSFVNNQASLKLRLKPTTLGLKNISATISDTGASTTTTINPQQITYSLSASSDKTLNDGSIASITYNIKSNSNYGSAKINVNIPNSLNIVSYNIPYGYGTFNNGIWTPRFDLSKNCSLTLNILNKDAISSNQTFNIVASGTNITSINRAITYIPKDIIVSPDPEIELPSVPKDMFISEVYDGTSVDHEYIIITEGDDLEVPPILSEYSNMINNPTDDINVSSTGPYAIPLNGPAGAFEIKVENTSEYSTINNVLLDVDLNIHESEEDGWSSFSHLTGDFNFIPGSTQILIPKIEQEKPQTFKMWFKYKEEPINVDIKLSTFDEELHSNLVRIKDLAFLNMNIDGLSEVDVNNELTLKYNFYNNSGVDTENVTNTIIIPKQFEIVNINNEDVIQNENILTWNIEDLPSNKTIYELIVVVKPKVKGRFITKFSTSGNEIWENEVTYNIDVGIYSNTYIKAKLDKVISTLDEKVLLSIDVRNEYKLSKNTYLNIEHTGFEVIDYDTEFGYYDYDNNKWVLGNLEVNKKAKLILTLSPLNLGNKNINISGYNYNDMLIRDFDLISLIIEKSPTLDFVVNQDKDFIMKNEEFKYNVKIKNSENFDINNIKLKCILNEDIEIVNISNDNFNLNNNTLLLDKLESNESIDFYINCKSDIRGEYKSIFLLQADLVDLSVIDLNIRCDDKAFKSNIEHIIKIYNFDKLNKYYKLNIDENAKLQKNYNTQNLSINMLDIEHYDSNNTEVYTGRNLSEIVDNINNKSIYVKSKFMRYGDNILNDDLYRINPNGFIHRFGLLKSEIFHRVGVIPEIINMTNYAMRWDVDKWGDKVWSGGIWDNGVFRVGIPYDKIPTNFIIPNMTELQSLIDKTRPAGTKGIPYYMFESKFNLGLNVDSLNVNINIEKEITNMKLLNPDYAINSYTWDSIQNKRVLSGETKYLLDENGDFILDKNGNKKIKLNYGSYYKNKISTKALTASGYLSGYNYGENYSQNNPKKILIGNIDVKVHSNILKENLNKYKNYSEFSNINILKDIKSIEPLIDDEEINDYRYKILLNGSFEVSDEKTIDFESSNKFKIEDDMIFESYDTAIFEIDNNISNNIEFGLYIKTTDSNLLTFSRNKNDIELQNGLKITLNTQTLYEAGISDINNYDKIYICVRKEDGRLFFSYSFNKEVFNNIFLIPFEKNIQEYGLYAMRR